MKFFNFLERWNFRKVCGNKLKFLDWTWLQMIRVGIIFFGIHSKDYELWNSILYTFRPTPGNSTVNDPIWPKMSDTVSDSKLFGTVRLIILAVRLLGGSERPKSELSSTPRRGLQSTSNIFYLIVLSSYRSLAFLNSS